jgi:hypothetical protein
MHTINMLNYSEPMCMLTAPVPNTDTGLGPANYKVLTDQFIITQHAKKFPIMETEGSML